MAERPPAEAPKPVNGDAGRAFPVQQQQPPAFSMHQQPPPQAPPQVMQREPMQQSSSYEEQKPMPTEQYAAPVPQPKPPQLQHHAQPPRASPTYSQPPHAPPAFAMPTGQQAAYVPKPPPPPPQPQPMHAPMDYEEQVKKQQQMGLPMAKPPPAPPQYGQPQTSFDSAHGYQAKPPPPPPAVPQQAPPPPGMRELRVEDALLYLDQVKMEFKDRPQIYNQFLAIMKNFKSQEVDTPGVIRRVSKLFRGYNNLILGFNTFLPEGYKISLADLERQEAEDQAQEQYEMRQQQQAQRQAAPPQYPQYQPPPPPPPVTKEPPKAPPPMPRPQAPPPAARAAAPPAQAPVPQHQAVEFDHAISYVTKIKRRFANEPSTYHKFLEILHTYQKEQRGIKEVLEQVAHLFQDHPDLLKEFTFFLPDAVQEQAKVRLHQAAAESEARISKQRQQQMDQYQMSRGGHQKFIDMTSSHMMEEGRGRKRPFDGSESNVYNSAVERQFFDAAREALTSYSRDGGQAWAEFLKCLDMYAQDILSRNEMLNFVEPLLGKRNTKLFEEFKRILNAAGSASHPVLIMEESWHSVPLSEIDFSRCRRCSPSYRALPRDYPAPPCSGRSELEMKILNDIWVSLPVGSEESYTFRHMRRNTYEETLFRVEDERFEIDMTIDSNAATLKRLEPIAEEIALLAKEEVASPELGVKPPADGAGIGGRRFQYTFDKSILGVIHRNSITRIYGDQGQEMLDLIYKNPTVAVPIVVQRLRQKDVEWRAVRDRLNRHWKEQARHNYYKSLDHRGLTWRTVDKRSTSTRTLLTDIKDRSMNNGKEGAEALKQKLDKAKEEHGTFYEVTMADRLAMNLDLTFLPKPDRRLFTPHLSMMFENNSWAQRDAYRILAFALERGHIPPADKERCHRLWIEFLGPFFGISLNWMQHPAVAYQESTAGMQTTPVLKPTVVSEDDEDSSMDDDAGVTGKVVTEEIQQNGSTDSKGREFTDHHPLPAGAHVSTLYGPGIIVEFRKSDHIYIVELSFGARGYLRPATVLCSILPVEKSAYTRELRSGDSSKLARPSDQLVIGTQSLYLFFRLYQILIRRLNIAKHLAYTVGDDPALQTLVEQMPSSNRNAVGRRRYEAYLQLVYGLLDGGSGGAAEGGKYEDRVRGLLGHGGYELATMDKLISHIWKNLQTIAADETMWNLIQLYRRHLSSGVFRPESFRQEAAYHSEGEPMYAFQYCPVQGKDSAVMHFEYLGVMEDPEDAASETSEEKMEDAIPSESSSNKRQRK